MNRRLKRGLELLLAICILLSVSTAFADREDQEEARLYWRIMGQGAPSGVLTRAMNEEYAALPREDKALALAELKSVTPDALLAFAAEYKLPLSMARYAYYVALAECLAAEIEQTSDITQTQRTLRLFLDMKDSAKDREANQERKAIRRALTEDEIIAYAAETGLPSGFLAWLLLDDEWYEGDWEDSDDWQEGRRSWILIDWVDEADLREKFGREAIVTEDDVEHTLRQNGYRIDD